MMNESITQAMLKVGELNLPPEIKAYIETMLVSDVILNEMILPELTSGGILETSAVIDVENNEVCVQIGPRDWQFDIATGECVGAGTFIGEEQR